MPGFNIHLAIGKRYLEKIKLDNRDNIKDEKAFLDGILAPDLVEDKNITHYTGTRNEDDLEQCMKQKVRLKLFLNENKIETDFEKGVFIHILTDYLFFNTFFDKEYIRSMTYHEFVLDLYYSYGLSNIYLEEKYNIDLKSYGDKLIKNIEENNKKNNIDKSELVNRRDILPKGKLDKFIEEVSDLDIYDEEKKYKEEE